MVGGSVTIAGGITYACSVGGGDPDAPKRRGGDQGFKSTQQRKQLEDLKNRLKARLTEKQREAFKKAIEDEKVGEQFLDKDTLCRIFDDIIGNM